MATPTRAFNQTLRHIRTLAGEPPKGRTDVELLEQFIARRDEDAFAAIVRQFGPFVMSVARRWLSDRHDAEDVVQATFLALARQARRLDRRKPLAGWLYTVAYRLARKAQVQTAKRAVRSPAPRALAVDPLAEITGRELLQAIDEELARLPERYRLPLLLCGLDGWTRDEAAQRLGWTVGTLHGRLERGRELLRQRLKKRGLTVPTTLVGLLIAENATALSPLLVASVTKTALMLPASAAASGAKIAAVAGVLLLAIGTGAGLALRPDEKREDKAAPKAPTAIAPSTARLDAFGDPLPDGVVARLGTVRLRHPNALSVAFSPDGKLVSFGADATVRWWDIESGRLLAARELAAEPLVVGTCLLSLDGRRAVFQKGAGQSMSMVICDAEKGNEIAVLPRSYNSVSEVEFAPNGHRVAFQDWYSKHLYVWESESAQLRDLSKFDSNSIAYAHAFSRDSRRFAAGIGDRVFVWDVESGAELMKLEGIPILLNIAFDITGDLLAVIGFRPNQSLEFYRISNGKRADGWKSPQGEFSWMQFCPDGKTIALRQAKQWIIWDPIAGKTVRTFQGSSDWGFAFSPDGRRVVSTGGAPFRVWEFATGKPLLTGLDAEGPGGEVAGIAVAPDGRTVATISAEEIRFWDSSTWRPSVRIAVDAHVWGRDMVFTPDGDLLAPASDGVAIECYDRTGKSKRRFGFDNSNGRHLGILKFRLADDRQQLVALSQVEGAGELVGLTFWDFASGKRLAEHRLQHGNALLSYSAYGAVAPDLRWHASKGSIWRLNEPFDQRKLDHPENCSEPTVISPDGRLIAVNLLEFVKQKLPDGRDWYGPHRTPGIAVFEAASGRRILQLDAGESGQLAFSRDGRELAAAGRDSIGIWDLRTGTRRVAWSSHIRCYGSYGHSSASAMTYSPDGRWLLTGHPDHTALIREVPVAARSQAQLPNAEREAAWRDLSADDAPRAYQAVWKLADDSGAVDFLRTKVRPASPLDEAKLAKLIAELDSPSFAKREAAGKSISELGRIVISNLEQVRAQSHSAEVKNRLQKLIDDLRDHPSAIELGQLRAIHVLELAGTAAARDHLKSLASGAPGARVTEAAAAALKRLNK